MDRLILRPHKLAKVPEPIKSALKDLTYTDLARLQAAFSNRDYFDFMSLPIEIRLMVLRMLLQSVSGFVTLECRGEHNHYRLPSRALFLVNKQMAAEAEMALTSSETAGLQITNRRYHYPTGISRKGYVVKAQHRELIQRFRKIDIWIDIKAANIDWDDEESGDLCKLFDKLIASLKGNVYRARHATVIEVSITFNTSRRLPRYRYHHDATSTTIIASTPRLTPFVPGYFDYDGPSTVYMPALMQHMQALNFMSKFRVAVRKVVPNINIYCNAEHMSYPSTIKLFWISPYKVQFEDRRNRRMGSMTITKTSRYIAPEFKVNIVPYVQGTFTEAQATLEANAYRQRMYAKKASVKAEKAAQHKLARAKQETIIVIDESEDYEGEE